ncbi:Aldo/keto reductase [Pholiota conissans]|uniref:Aldo/keto reductase n=1 Tax=Pholiota conissans TaxID=109636 RepID=A0A9P6CQ59_9AGAR|nr:Aldo/keto reductase [Pholiota conissans]
MPVLGYGTYELDGKEAYEGVLSALEAGYRHIDSAAWYENEREVGRAILDFCERTDMPREAIFYTTKLKQNNGYANVKKAIQRSLDACRLGYIDLYLIHGPLGGPEARKESWRAICDFQAESGGLIRSIGISTFGIRHMKDILELPLPKPTVHQIDLHPFMGRSEIVAFTKEHDMVLEAWAPLVRGYRFTHPTLVALEKKHRKKPAQILIRYSLQKGYVPLPKSAAKSRIISNSQVFDFSLSPDEISSLDQLDEGLVTDWDPTDCA